MGKQMFRKDFEILDRDDCILYCNEEVDYMHELGAVSSYFHNKVPVMFNNVKDSDMRVIAGLYGNRDLYYKMMNTDTEHRIEKIANAIAHPQPYKVVDRGPVHENVIEGRINLEEIMPLTHFHKRDAGRFITSGVMTVKDPGTGEYHTSVRRLQYNGDNSLTVYASSHPYFNEQLKVLDEKGEDLEAAIVLGYDAEFLLASQVSTSTYGGLNKFEIDSALRGEPLELVKCVSNDVLVPAQAEIVLEGRIITDSSIKEGPFGELMGYYGGESYAPYMLIDAVTTRDDPVYNIAFPCEEEHLSNGLIREAELYYYLKHNVNVVDVNISEAGGYRFNGIISIEKEHEADGKTAILSALGLNKDMKHAIIVDTDVDIYDRKDVINAIVARTQASDDYVIIPRAKGSGLEPSYLDKKYTDKVGIDATAPLGTLDGLYERVSIEGFEDGIDITKYFPEFKK